MDTHDDHASQAALTYGSYLRVDDLLALQRCRSEGPEHDEMLFIVIHQVYELWFKELLHELDRVRRLLEQDDAYRAQHTLKRILTILKVMVAQLDILETMTPLEFLSFRDRLQAASGFQSDQFRQLEFVLGFKSPKAMERFLPGTRARTALERRWNEPTLWDAFLEYLNGEGYAMPLAQMERDVTAADRGFAGAPADSHRDLPQRSQEQRVLRASRGSRRGVPGVALPPREDGAADDRLQAGYGRVAGREVSGNDAVETGVSRPLGDQRGAIRVLKGAERC